ncbi:MAG: aminotransferase class I/II-fold pyridoxal phosphate-dependent enzyme [Planctomycetales bacterium]
MNTTAASACGFAPSSADPPASPARAIESLDWPLMRNNLRRGDLDAAIDLLRQDDPVLTQATHVARFEAAFAEWVGTRHAVFVNSGATANLMTMMALRERFGGGQVIVPTLTWVSDIAAVIHCGFEPVFVDIDPRTLCMSERAVLDQLGPETRAVFLTQLLGFVGLSRTLLDELEWRGIPLIEDCCESHGATFAGRRVGSFGLMSNFSFYYAHHMSTVEGGMICTDDADLYQMLRMLRSHGMVRESTSEDLRDQYYRDYPDLNPGFAFAYCTFNFRNNEINAAIGLAQLPRLDEAIEARTANLRLFLDALDPDRYRTDLAIDGSSNYALPLILRHADPVLWAGVRQLLSARGVEFRQGLSGGGNQLRQPYLRKIVGDQECAKYPEVEHIHFHSLYLGNYPDLDQDQIGDLCRSLNALPIES